MQSQKKKQLQKRPKGDLRRIRAHREGGDTSWQTISGTLAGRLANLEDLYAKALRSIEDELERPEQTTRLLKFLHSLEAPTFELMAKVENYYMEHCDRKDGLITLEHKGKKWREIPALHAPVIDL